MMLLHIHSASYYCNLYSIESRPRQLTGPFQDLMWKKDAYNVNSGGLRLVWCRALASRRGPVAEGQMYRYTVQDLELCRQDSRTSKSIDTTCSSGYDRALRGI